MLYEVITIADRWHRDVQGVVQDRLEPLAVAGEAQLLVQLGPGQRLGVQRPVALLDLAYRAAEKVRARLHVQPAEAHVITSYSIHYTKLYESRRTRSRARPRPGR